MKQKYQPLLVRYVNLMLKRGEVVEVKSRKPAEWQPVKLRLFNDWSARLKRYDEVRPR